MSEREEFEAWWESRGMFKPSRNTEPGYEHEYELAIAENAWKAWQARAILAAPQSKENGK